MKAKERMYQRIEKHGKQLIAVFGLPEDTDAIKLCKRLHTLENKAHFIMERYANGDIDTDKVDTETEAIAKAVGKIIGVDNMDKLYINRDPRGYTLKLTEDATKQAQDAGINIHRDWGCYGILAPEFDGKA